MSYDINELRSSGIYAIVNTATGRMYIGATGRFGARWTKHRLHLRRNEHDNQELQSDWNIYTSEAFEFRILEFVGQMRLRERERVHIQQAASVYNRHPGDLLVYTPDETD